MPDILKVESLVRRYGSHTALDHVSFELTPGIYGLLGPNGAGKTTLMRLLTLCDEADEGTILWNGQEIRSLKENYRRVIGYMPQQQSLNADFTVLGFMYYMAALKEIERPDEKVTRLLKQLHLFEHRKKKLSSLSGGMRQRLLIGQALLNDPSFLLLDEPTAGLDPAERRNLRSLISSLGHERIILLATHVTSDVELTASKIILMKEGRILTIQDQESLMKATAVYESEQSVEELLKEDPGIRVINRIWRGDQLITRFISEKPFGKRTDTTMDDVYLDWLG